MLKKLFRIITLSFFKKKKKHPKVTVRTDFLKLSNRELTAFAENVHRKLAAFSPHYPMPYPPVEALREGIEELNLAIEAAQTDGSRAGAKKLHAAHQALRKQLRSIACYLSHLIKSSDAPQQAGFRAKPQNHSRQRPLCSAGQACSLSSN